MPEEKSQPVQSTELQTRLALAIQESPRVYAFLVGAGLSSSAGIPTGWDIMLDLIRRVALAQDEPEQPDWATWYRTKFEKEPNYPALLAELAPTQSELRAHPAGLYRAY